MNKKFNLATIMLLIKNNSRIIIFLAVLVIGGLIIFHFFGPDSYTNPYPSLTIEVIPSDAKISIGDKKVEIGKAIKLPRGVHKIKIERPGFDTSEFVYNLVFNSYFAPGLIPNTTETRAWVRDNLDSKVQKTIFKRREEAGKRSLKILKKYYHPLTKHIPDTFSDCKIIQDINSQTNFIHLKFFGSEEDCSKAYESIADKIGDFENQLTTSHHHHGGVNVNWKYGKRL